MNSKTRGILLSVFAVLFAAASVFAITVDDLSVVVDDTITPPTVEGYNYMQRVYVDTSELEAGQTVGKVSWEIYPVYDWLTWRPGSDDKNVIIEGILPKYVENQDPYVLHVIAHVSGDIASTDAEGNPVSDSEGNDVYISGNISADVDGSGLEIGVEMADETTIGLLEDMVSVNVSKAAHGINKPGKDYSITINFPTSTAVSYVEDTNDDGDTIGTHTESTDVFVNAQLEYTDPDPEDPSVPVISTENLNLPSWLAYEVLETQYNGAYEYEQDDDGNNILSSGKIVYDDSTKYVKSLRIFYSADTEPANETAGVVRILVTPADTTFSDADDAKSFADSYPNGATIGWSMDYYGIPSMKLSGDFSPNPLKVYAGNKAEAEITFTDVMPKSGDFWYMSPDISADVSFDVSWTVANESASNDSSVEGKFTVKATPRNVENKDYTTTFYFTDSNDNVASAGLTVNVTIPVITISSDNPVVHMSKPPFVTDWVDWHTEWYYAKPVSIDLSVIPSGLSFDCVSLDETTDTVKHGRFVFAYMPMTTTGWSGTVKVYDEYGGSADIAVSLDVESEHVNEPMTTSVTVSGDSSSSPTFYAGENATVTVNADNAYGKVRWGISNLADLTALGIELSKDYETRRSATYTFKLPITLPAGTYTANITATDSLDRTAAVYNLTITAKAAPITLSGDLASIDVVYPASGEATVEYYYSPFVSWSMSPDISADISFDITSIPAESADSTTVEGVISVVATPITASTDKYTTTLYFTDKNGNTDSRDITINVTLTDFEVTASADSLSLIKGNSADVTFTASGNVGLVTWTLGEIPGGITVESADTLNATQYDTVRSYVVTANTAGNYSFDVTAKDTAGRTVSATINVEVELPDMTIDAKVSGDTTIYAGENATVTLTADNAYGKVTWGVSNMADLAALGITFNKVSETDTSAVYTIGTPLTLPGGTYTANITAKDSSDRTAAVYNITITAKSAPITLSGDLASIDVVYPASGEATVQYYYSPFVSWSMSPDISADVSLDVTSTPANSTTVQGVISVVATPLTASADTYTTTLTFTDNNGNTDSREITINVTLPDLAVKASATSLSLIEGNSEDVTFTASGNAGLVTWTLGEIQDGITVTSSDIANATAYGSIMSYVVTANTAGSYSFDVTAKDAAGRNASATVNVTVTASGDFAVTTESSSLNVDVNTPTNISFTAVNNSGDVTWKLGDVPSGIRVEATAIPYATENHTLMLYTVTGLVPGASGTITVTATDAAGHTASSTVTITVASSTPTPGTFAVSPSAPSVTVGAGASQNVSLTASGNSGLVTWTLGRVPSGVTVAAAEDTSYATREMTTMIYTVTGVTAGTYTIPVTATDAAGHTSTATISVTVTAATLTITPAETSVTVGVGITQNVAFTASGNSGYVAWTVSTSSTAFTISPAPSAYATQDNTRTAFAITGVTAGASGTVTVTATDSAGHSATATISVTVSSSGGGDSGKISTPKVDITDDTVQSTIKQSLFAKLGSKITGSTEIAALPSSATSGTVSYVGTNTVYIPTIVVEVAKIYVFGVSLDNLAAGSLMTWTPHVSSSSTGEYLTASAEEENATFLDDSGNEVTRVPANKHVNVAAYFEPGKIYEPSITATSGPIEVVGVGSSSGGCSAGLGALVSALAAAFFISKKRS